MTQDDAVKFFVVGVIVTIVAKYVCKRIGI